MLNPLGFADIFNIEQGTARSTCARTGVFCFARIHFGGTGAVPSHYDRDDTEVVPPKARSGYNSCSGTRVACKIFAPDAAASTGAKFTTAGEKNWKLVEAGVRDGGSHARRLVELSTSNGDCPPYRWTSLRRRAS